MHARVGIAGVGLIGGSIALRVAELGWSAGVYDVDPSHARIASERLGAAFVSGSFADLASRCDVLVLAAPLDATLAQLAELERVPPAARLVIDTASVKEPVARAGARVAAFVPTHPIAGSEQSGPSAARGDLFAGRTWSYDRSASSADVRERATEFIASMGAVPLSIASDEHDRVVALTSHLPQLLATLLASRLEPWTSDPQALALCGTGIRSMLRLAGSSHAVWEAIFRENAKPIAQEVRRLAEVLTVVAAALENGEPAPAARDFERAAIALARLSAAGPPDASQSIPN